MEKSTKRVLWSLLALCLALTVCVGGALAYFTTNTQASGGRTVRSQTHTTIEESYADWVKHVQVRCQPVSVPMYVRARGYAASAYPLRYSGEGWEVRDDGYCYFATPLANAGPDASQPAGTVVETTVLDVTIDGVQTDGAETAPFDVVVIYETVPVQYNENGEAYADWNLALLVPGNHSQGGDNA